jgi:hypothetical protein
MIRRKMRISIGVCIDEKKGDEPNESRYSKYPKCESPGCTRRVVKGDFPKCSKCRKSERVLKDCPRCGIPREMGAYHLENEGATSVCPTCSRTAEYAEECAAKKKANTKQMYVDMKKREPPVEIEQDVVIFKTPPKVRPILAAPNPVRCAEGKGIRCFVCPEYWECLSLAASGAWTGFTCAYCQAHDPKAAYHVRVDDRIGSYIDGV